MFDWVAGFVITALSSLIIFVFGYRIRKRGPKEIVNGIDWERVSDKDGLSRFLGNVVYVFGFVILAFGVATLTIGEQHPEWRSLIGDTTTVAALVTFLIQNFGIRRFQDRPLMPHKRDGRR